MRTKAERVINELETAGLWDTYNRLADFLVPAKNTGICNRLAAVLSKLESDHGFANFLFEVGDKKLLPFLVVARWMQPSAGKALPKLSKRELSWVKKQLNGKITGSGFRCFKTFIPDLEKRHGRYDPHANWENQRDLQDCRW